LGKMGSLQTQEKNPVEGVKRKDKGVTNMVKMRGVVWLKRSKKKHLSLVGKKKEEGDIKKSWKKKERPYLKDCIHAASRSLFSTETLRRGQLDWGMSKKKKAAR